MRTIQRPPVDEAALDRAARRRRGKQINCALADQQVMDLVFNALAHAMERRVGQESIY
ncbi:MAG: hypothetical protein JWO48_3880 [Bryobacterales bacterium]|nr:hypothetical protein [Bryobacterales bacterium]